MGTDHFGFIYHGDLIGFCDEIREKGVTFAVKPWEFLPGSVICYSLTPTKEGRFRLRDAMFSGAYFSQNQTDVIEVNATDADGNATVSYVISGGSDAGKFDLNATTGVLTFKIAPDFENPTDTDANNTYVVEVNASDGTAWDLQTITVSVANANEAPTAIALGGALSSLPEDSNTSSATKVGGVVITDPDTTNSSSLPPANSHLVPSEFATIQAAIDASSHGDEVFVSAGTYVENLNFNGKNIIVTSIAGAESTIIEPESNSIGPAVIFENGESGTIELSGFTIQNAFNDNVPDTFSVEWKDNKINWKFDPPPPGVSFTS